MKQKIKKSLALILAILMAFSCYSAAFASETEVCPEGCTFGEPTVTKEPTCGESGTQSKECTVCGNVVNEKLAATGEHIFTGWRVGTEPTCTEIGEEYRYCRVCHFNETNDIEALGGEHQMGGWELGEFLCTEGGTEYSYCEKCSYFETRPVEATGEHTWGDWTDREFSCTDGGEEYRYCENCYASNAKYYPVLGDHDWNNWEYSYGHCDTGVYERRTCKNCDVTEGRYLDEKEHSWGELDVESEPTCGEEGYGYKVCTVCDYEEYEEIPTTGEHDWSGWYLYNAATCTDAGSKARECYECGDMEFEEIPALGGEHVWGDWDLNDDGTIVDEDGEYDGTRPTCKEPGEKIRHCKICRTSDAAEIPALGGEHEWSNWEHDWGSCLEGGEESRVCSKCDKYEYSDFDMKDSHTWPEYGWLVDYEPTCTDEGLYYRTCEYCSRTEEKTVPALGGEHSWGEWATESPADCYNEGEKVRVCSICEAEDYAVIEAAGHSYTAWYWDFVNMNVYHYCTDCNYSEATVLEIDKDEETGIEISYPENKVGDFRAEQIDDVVNEGYQAFAGKYGLALRKVYEIIFVDNNGIITQPERVTKVKIPYNVGSKTFKVYRLEDDGKFTDMNATLAEDAISFETDHFSYYAIVEVSGTTPDTPDTPDEPTKPSEPSQPSTPEKECSCNCHSEGISKLIFDIILFLSKIFGMNDTCTCGVKHY